MNGILGERLFMKFDKEQTGFISQENFINGLNIFVFELLWNNQNFYLKYLMLTKQEKY